MRGTLQQMEVEALEYPIGQWLFDVVPEADAIAISLLRLAGETNIARATRALAAQPHRALARLGV